jgi:hypothetical protein
VGDETLIENTTIIEYLDTTFSPRRNEIFETGPASKNTLLINGVGVVDKSAVHEELIEIGGMKGIRLDATEAMGTMRDGSAALFCGRIFLYLPNGSILILDRVETPHPARVEARLFSSQKVAATDDSAQIKGQKKSLSLAFAADGPALLQTARMPATSPQAPGLPAGWSMLRWCSRDRICSITFATLLTPGTLGEKPATIAQVAVETRPDSEGTTMLFVSINCGDLQWDIKLSADLRAVTAPTLS